MSVDSTAATRASGSDSDLSSYSNWSVLDDSDNSSQYARNIRMGGKKPKIQSKSKLKPPKANKKFDIDEEIFMMEDVLSKSSSEGSVNMQYENLDYKEDAKENSSDAFEEILPDSIELLRKSSTHFSKRKMKERLSGTRPRVMSIVHLIGLLVVMTSLSYITALFGANLNAEPAALITNENLFRKIADNINNTFDNNLNRTIGGIPVISDKDIPFKLPEEPTVLLLPSENMQDENITKIIEPEPLVKPHFHNDGKVTYAPMTFKEYLRKQKNKLEEMKATKDAANTFQKNSESLSKTVSDILKNGKSSCDEKFKCCSFKKHVATSRTSGKSDKPKVDSNKLLPNTKFAEALNKTSTMFKERKDYDKPAVLNTEQKTNVKEITPNQFNSMEGLKWDFNTTRIDDIINNFSRYVKKSALSTPKEQKLERTLSRATKEDIALHKVIKNNDVFKRCSTKHKDYLNFKNIKDCFLFRLAVCMLFDIIAIIVIKKLGLACIGRFRKIMQLPTKSNLELQTIKKKSCDIKRVDMFKTLPFHHRVKPRIVKKVKKIEKVTCPECQLICKEPIIESPSDYYLFMLGLKMKALDKNIKSREVSTSAIRLGVKRYSTEFKQSLIKQLSDIYKNTVKNHKLREDLVFCIMKIYECKFEYAPTSSTYATSEALNRLDKFKVLLVDYYRYQDNPLTNTKYLKNATTKQKEDLCHVLELMLEDQKLGATRSNIECTFTADNSTFKYEAPVQQCQSACLQKPVSTRSSSNVFKTNNSSVLAINDPAYYMRERFSLLAKFWKLKQAYFTKRIQICNILKDKLSESSIAEHEGANILDGIINSAITNSSTSIRSAKMSSDKYTNAHQCPRDAFKVPDGVITEVVKNVHKVFDACRREEQQPKLDKCHDGPPMCKRICRVNNELYRELFEKKAKAIQEKDISRGKTLLAKASEMSTKISLSKSYQARDPRFHKKL